MSPFSDNAAVAAAIARVLGQEETTVEHVRNALAILVSAAVREGGSVRYAEADVEATIRRLRAAVQREEERLCGG